MLSVGRRRGVVALLALITALSGFVPSMAAPSAVAADECGTISGNVHHADGTPIAGAAVRLADSDLATLGDATSDGDGNYMIDVVPQQPFWIHAFVDEIQRTTVVGGDSGISIGCTSGVFDVEVGSGGVSGVLTDADGNPAAGYYVQVCGDYYAGLGYCHEPQTSADGSYSVLYLRPGENTVRVLDNDGPVELTAGSSVPITIDNTVQTLDLQLAATPPPATGSVSGHLSYPDATPIDSANVDLIRSGFGGVAFTQPDASGFYQLSGLEAGDYSLSIYVPPADRSILTPAFAVGSDAVIKDLSLPDGGRSGFVTLSDGSAAGDVQVQLCGSYPGTDLAWCHVATTGADGFYQILYLEPGEATATLADSNGNRLSLADGTTEFQTVIGNGVEGMDLQLGSGPAPTPTSTPGPEGGYVFGSVTASDGGEIYGGYIDVCGDPDCSALYQQVEISDTGDPLAWEFQTGEMDAGEYHLVVHPYTAEYARYFVAQTLTVNVPSGATQQDIVFQVAPITTVQGHITFADGSPAVGVNVAACFAQDSCTAGGWNTGVGDGAAYGKTDANGFYQLTGVPVIGDGGKIAYRAADDGINVLSYTGGFSSPTHVHDVVIDRPSGGVDGLFLYSDGSPVVGADISWHDTAEVNEWGDPVYRYVLPTGADGSFDIRGLAPGTYWVIGEDHRSRQSVSVAVTIGTDVEPVLLQHGPLPTGGLRGTVVDHLGNPVPEAEVDFTYQTGPESGASGFTRADESGVFEILYLPPFSVSGTIYHPDGDRWLDFSEAIGSEVIERTFTLGPPPTAIISGTLTVDGEPQAYTFFEACTATRCQGVETNENGHYELGPLAPGFYLFSVGRFDDPAGPIEVAYESFEHDVAIVLPTGGIEGTVVSGGSPVAEVDMTACSIDGCVHSFTNELGNYSFNMLPPGDYHLVVHHAGDFADPNGPVTVDAGIASHDIEISGGSISGGVEAGGEPVEFAWVEVCRDGFGCVGTSAGYGGEFVIGLLPDGDYTVRAHPNSGGYLPTTSTSQVTITSGSAESAGTIALTPIQPLPADGSTTITGTGVTSAPGEVPSSPANTPVTIGTTACTGGVGTYTITSINDPSHVLTGSLTETSAGTYEAVIAFDFGGPALVEMAVACPDPAEDTQVGFNVYIDPSGWVRNTVGEPINGATVVLYRAPTPAGPWEQVPDGSDIMSPSNRTNPDVTEDDGWRNFGWDVVAGYYKVRASAPGCVDPNNPVRGYVDTIAYEIPPPVLDIDLRLFCGESAPSDQTDPTVVITTPADGADYLLGSAVIVDYACADEDVGSGLVSCVGDIADGAPLDTATPGLHSFGVTATDAAGNSATITVSYRIVYEVTLFTTLAAPPEWNAASAGGNVALRFSLAGVSDLRAVESAMSRAVSCTTQLPLGTLTGQGMSAPALDDDGRYKIAWKTHKSWAGTCREVVIALDDGTAHSILFVLTKKAN